MRDFKICHLQGGVIRRKKGKIDKDSATLINQAMLDFKNQLLTVKEYLFTVAAKYLPLPFEDNSNAEEFPTVSYHAHLM